MHIHVMNSSCVRVSITAEECAFFAIDYDSFSGEGHSSRLFIASVLQRLEEMGMSVERTEKLTAEIFEGAHGGLIVYISGKGLRLKEQSGEAVVLCDTPAGVAEALAELPEPESAELYKYLDRYALIYPGTDLRSTQPAYICAKIKEYGELLSDTPFQLLYDEISRAER